MSNNLEYIKAIARARYLRLKSKADRTKRNYEKTMDNTKVNLIKYLHSRGNKNSHIACILSLTKEYVDTVLQGDMKFCEPQIAENKEVTNEFQNIVDTICENHGLGPKINVEEVIENS